MNKFTYKTDLFNSLKKKINRKKAIIGVIGLGYVGLPLALTIAKKKFKVIGFDIDKTKLNSIKRGKSYFSRITKKEINLLKKVGTFENTYNKIIKCDVIIICVPTPLNNDNKPNLSYIRNTIKLLKKFVTSGKLIILESTSYPGTTKEEIINKFEKKFNIGKDLFIGFSSERINPGENEKTIYKVPKVVSGYSNNCQNLVKEFYKKFFHKIHSTNTIEEAEFSKVLENIFRSVNIALVNEMKLISEKLKINLNNVIDAASTKPYGFMKFLPGPGIGGHCIPIDPYYLYWKAKSKGFDSKFIKLAGKTNILATEIISKKIINYFKKNKKTKILILGISYKKNIEDARESPALQIIAKLNKVFKVDYSDPYVKKFPKTRRYKINLKSKNLTPEQLKKYDAAILVTDHDKFNYVNILKNSKLIFDCRGRYSKIASEKIKRI